MQYSDLLESIETARHALRESPTFPRTSTFMQWAEESSYFRKRFPLVLAALESGLIRLESYDEVVGTAADGVEVALGSLATVDLADRVEGYLFDHPDPSYW